MRVLKKYQYGGRTNFWRKNKTEDIFLYLSEKY
jgi:hypothetical protein